MNIQLIFKGDYIVETLRRLRAQGIPFVSFEKGYMCWSSKKIIANCHTYTMYPPRLFTARFRERDLEMIKLISLVEVSRRGA